MERVKNKIVLSCSIFLSSMLIILNCFAIGDSSAGVNTVREEIEFEIIIQDTLFAATAGVLDFGEILKDSIGKYKAETKIEIEASEEIGFIKLKYLDGEYQEDGTQKLNIFYVEEKDKNINFKILEKESTELSELEVYLYEFENFYEFELNEDGSKYLEVPVQGEIRSTKNVKLGKYEGNMRVEIEINPNNEEVVKR